MLADLYFPSAHGALEQMKSIRSEAATIQTAFKEHHRQSGGTSQEHAALLRMNTGASWQSTRKLSD